MGSLPDEVGWTTTSNVDLDAINYVTFRYYGRTDLLGIVTRRNEDNVSFCTRC